MTVAALIVVSLIAGMFLFSRQARIAEMHRAQAEARFNDIRKLTNSLIFEIDGSIRDLPGGAATRKTLINTALEYLGTLAKDAAGDPDLQIDTAAAYQRLGDIQGSFQASQDDYSGALKSYQKALTLLEQAATSPQGAIARRSRSSSSTTASAMCSGRSVRSRRRCPMPNARGCRLGSG